MDFETALHLYICKFGTILLDNAFNKAFYYNFTTPLSYALTFLISDCVSAQLNCLASTHSRLGSSYQMVFAPLD
jgi:hypothetical protein